MKGKWREERAEIIFFFMSGAILITFCGFVAEGQLVIKALVYTL